MLKLDSEQLYQCGLLSESCHILIKPISSLLSIQRQIWHRMYMRRPMHLVPPHRTSRSMWVPSFRLDAPSLGLISLDIGLAARKHRGIQANKQFFPGQGLYCLNLGGVPYRGYKPLG
jgi:hypothetical protein